METIRLFVPNHLITAAEKRYKQIKREEADPEFRKMVILTTLAVPVNFGHFILKTNNTRGSSLNWILKHNCQRPKSQRPKCTRQAKVESLQENEISISINGTCRCGSQSADKIIQSKLSYIKYWQYEDTWIPANLLMLMNEAEVDNKDEAAVMCFFGGVEESGADTATASTAPTNRGDVREIIHKTEQTVTGREFRIELGGSFEGLFEYIKTLFLNFIYKGPTTTTTTTDTTRF